VTQLVFCFWTPVLEALKLRKLKTAPPGPRSVVLVGCGAAKLAKRSKAKDLYVGSLFRAARRHAERLGCEWRVLSARYGLVNPERRIAPYNERLVHNALARIQWATAATTGLACEVGTNIEVTILAGSDYADPIRAQLEARGIKVHTPLAGLTMGRRLAWFKAQASFYGAI
jgi:hypothetical protein